MQILVDADACPVKQIIIKVAKEKGIPVLLFVDTAHILQDAYAQVVLLDKGRDAVDIALVNCVKPGDLVITQDYGLASMGLSKKAIVLHQNGFEYTSENIDRLLFERHLSAKQRNAGKRVHGVKKRKEADNLSFEDLLRAKLS